MYLKNRAIFNHVHSSAFGGGAFSFSHSGQWFTHHVFLHFIYTCVKTWPCCSCSFTSLSLIGTTLFFPTVIARLPDCHRFWNCYHQTDSCLKIAREYFCFGLTFALLWQSRSHRICKTAWAVLLPVWQPAELTKYLSASWPPCSTQ